MGTSGAYEGSERQAWQRARNLYSEALTEAGDTSVPDAVAGIVDALVDEDPESLVPPNDHEPETVLMPAPALLFRPSPTSRRAQGSGSGQTIYSARTPNVGRAGGGSRRQLSTAARRGGLALGAGYALQRGDREALAELGLDLDELRGMSPRDQRLALLNATLGDATHPDDVAVRQAANEFLKLVLTDPPPTPLDVIRDFIAALVLRLGMVELKRQLDSGDIDPQTAAHKEEVVANWIRARLSSENFGVSGAIVAITEFQRVAARLTATALAILGSGS